MNFPFFIAKRYLISKKSQNSINIITAIASLGVCIGTAALIIVLSVFNGFENLVISMFNTFDSDIQITASNTKTFDATAAFEQIKRRGDLLYYSDVLEENVLLKHDGKQFVATIKGIDEKLIHNNHLDSILIEGNCLLKCDSSAKAIVGQGLANILGIQSNDYFSQFTLYAPRYGATINTENPEGAFSTRLVQPIGIFSVQPEFDAKYVLVDIDFAREVLDAPTAVTSIELGFTKGSNVGAIKRELEAQLGRPFQVKNRFEQHELLYKIMRSEKWAVFMILTFILIIATFNVVGSLSMLIIEKQKDISTLTALGSSAREIQKIFLIEGMMISIVGAIFGIFVGWVVCILQQKFGLISLHGSGNFVIDAYPVKMKLVDFIGVFLTVVVIGFLAAWYPASRMTKEIR